MVCLASETLHLKDYLRQVQNLAEGRLKTPWHFATAYERVGLEVVI